MVEQITVTQIVMETLSGIIINLPWFILFWYGFRMIAKEIKQGVKEMPKWISMAFTEIRKTSVLERAIDNRTK